jgi:4'-phosphopantetheinyl transferase
MSDRLDHGHVHVWYIRSERVRQRERLVDYQRLLSPAERARHRRFRVAGARHQYLVAHALVRTTLSRYADVEPRAWVFGTNAHGRPHIAAPAGLSLNFNLSHTDGLVACAVTRGREVGIDVENTTRRGATVKIADRYFAPAEVAALHRLPAALQRPRFFAYWTLKESYIKARGMGLSLPLAQFAFELVESGPIRIAFDPRLNDDRASWQFALLQPTEHHVMALSVRRGGDPELTIDVRETGV